MKKLLLFPTLLVCANVALIASSSKAEISRILQESGIKGGFVAHVGSKDGSATNELRPNESFQVQALVTDTSELDTVRKEIRKAAGTYGPIAADLWKGGQLPYIDNLVNLLLIEEGSDVSQKEINRVLTPLGKAYQKKDGKWKGIDKQWSKDIDEWTHYLHGADGNAVAKDTRVGPPRRLQWVGSPRWSRHHDRMASMSAMTSSKGRLFYVMDEGSRVSIQLPPDWKLIARDAFNGVVLWKRKIPKWHHHLWPLKSGPTQLARRLVSKGNRVYFTMGITAAVSALDATSGKTLVTFEGSEGSEEILVAGGSLLALVNKGASELKDYVPKNNVGDQGRVRTEFVWDEKPRILMCYDAETGKKRWEHESPVAPLSPASDGERAYFHDGKIVTAIEIKTGKVAWKGSPSARRSSVQFNFGPRLVVVDGVVVFAGGDRSMTAYEATTGKTLWTSPHERGGYQSPEDLLVIGGLVWSAPITSTKDSGVWTGRDLKTGETKRSFPPKVNPYWFHHRCHIAKATERFLLASRTGIEFVDIENSHWDLNHWVRGGCLYGVMPCNGLVYAPPHNCACYPEAKLFGLNALAPEGSPRKSSDPKKDHDRLEKGPAYGKTNPPEKINPSDWPTYRGNTNRSGKSNAGVSPELDPAWETEIGDGDRLSSVIVADGKLFVAEIDAHAVHCLDTSTGKILWTHVAGGRIDSPPSYHEGAVLFGSADGTVTSLRASDGALSWRFQAAPEDLRHMAFEQLESVWPVSGNILIREGAAYFVSGRSNFLDGGLRFYKLDAKTGKVLVQTEVNETDPETGKNLAERHQILNMPVGLTDVLSCDENFIYMRSQKFDHNGNRVGIGPHSGTPASQGSVQKGEGVHLFSPTGFLDGDWFHRSYWVYGRSFAGGHGGYYQAGKFAPSGRILVHDKDTVYGFGRKPQYLRWTTTIEHQLFSAPMEQASGSESAGPATNRRGPSAPTQMITFGIPKTLNPMGKALAIEAWIKAEKNDGVIVARGGPRDGFAITIEKGRPRFHIRASDKLASIGSRERIVGKWHHVAGVLSKDKSMRLYLNGRLIAKGEAPALIGSDPIQSLDIGADSLSAVGNYASPFNFTGLIDEVRLHFGEMDPAFFSKVVENAGPKRAIGKNCVLACSFDDGKATDLSSGKHQATVNGAKPEEGKFGGAFRFVSKPKKGGNQKGGSGVAHNWTHDVPVLARGMVLAEDVVFVAGPPDVMDEEETFKRIMARDSSVNEVLAKQQAALAGTQGSVLLAISTKTGETLAKYNLGYLPTWDGLVAANGKLFLSTEKGTITCLKGQK
ncbi:PQQ-binding-like beta-propeller repeat protein [Verrucomicrobia bacterium]|nr:PQQ-binding-like beta-propeller repeat protein [Verrucomicrobiota bacterium]